MDKVTITITEIKIDEEASEIIFESDLNKNKTTDIDMTHTAAEAIAITTMTFLNDLMEKYYKFEKKKESKKARRGEHG